MNAVECAVILPFLIERAFQRAHQHEDPVGNTWLSAPTKPLILGRQLWDAGLQECLLHGSPFQRDVFSAQTGPGRRHARCNLTASCRASRIRCAMNGRLVSSLRVAA